MAHDRTLPIGGFFDKQDLKEAIDNHIRVLSDFRSTLFLDPNFLDQIMNDHPKRPIEKIDWKQGF